MQSEDMVNHPKHYEGSTSLECIDVMVMLWGPERVSTHCLITAFKYLWRHRHKGGLEDVDKASWYMNKAEELDPAIIHTVTYRIMFSLLDKARKEYDAVDKD